MISLSAARPERTKRGWPRRAARLLLSVALLAAFAIPATGWSDRGHHLITDEAVRRLPPPLRDLLSTPVALERLKAASAAPDGWRQRGSPHYSRKERPRHFLNLDALSDQPYPFPDFPRDYTAAVTQFGEQVLRRNGTAPWAAAEALEAFTGALSAGQTDEIYLQAGAMAHYAADLHMPLHVTKNYKGQLTGNDGVHKALEVGLVHRHLAFYETELRKLRYDVPFLEAPPRHLVEWAIEAYGRIPPVLEADATARRKAGYNPAEHLEDLDDVNSERARSYYDSLKQELAARGSPEAVAMRDAAGHLAELVYTAWVRAGKPLALAKSGEEPPRQPAVPYWLLVPAGLLFLLLLLPRRRPARPGSDRSSE